MATSNLGAEIIQENMRNQGETDLVKAIKSKNPKKTKTEVTPKNYSELKNELMNVLRAFFRPEFLNRIDDIIIFQPLSKKEIKSIVKLQLEKLESIARGQNVHLVFDDTVTNYLAEIGYAPEYGARELKRKIKSEIENSLARELLSGKIKEGDTVKVKYDPKQNQIRYETDVLKQA